MVSMISILNEASEAKHRGVPIMEDDYFNIRLSDLKEFEDETGIMFINSPNCKLDLKSIVSVKELANDNFKKCKDVSDIVEYFNQKGIVVYLDIAGSDMVVTYVDGCLTNIQTNDGDIEKKIKLLNLPYKIKKDGVYVVKGKIAHTNKMVFYVSDILEGGNNNLKDDLNEAEGLNFDIIPFWFVNNLNSQRLKDTIDYVFDYMVDDDLDCNGIIFKFNEKKFGNVLNFVGCCYSNENKE